MTTKTAAHTPTPWEIQGFEICNEIQKGLVQAVPIYTGRIEGTLSPVSDDWDTAQANAAFIVKAVNCHEELVSLLKEIDQYVELGWKLQEKLDKAIANAEGK